MKAEKLLERITLDTNVMTGKPVIRGTRLTVQYILGLLAHGASVKDILEEYKGLNEDNIKACLLLTAESLENTTPPAAFQNHWSSVCWPASEASTNLPTAPFTRTSEKSCLLQRKSVISDSLGDFHDIS
jgi:uncharacterized protein (DUF433 family)